MFDGLGRVLDLIFEYSKLQDRKIDDLVKRIHVLEKTLSIQNHYDIPERRTVNTKPTSYGTCK